MVIDINTYIGHWPFRKLKNSTASDLVKIMDESGVDMAAVSSINSIFYRDTMQGNLELVDQIEQYKERFLPLAVINPAYPGWKKDFLCCIEQLGMKGFELYPYYHQYNLDDEPSIELLKLAAAKGVPVHLPCAIENIRQRHWMDTTRNLTFVELERALDLCPDTDFIVTNGPTHDYACRLKAVADTRPGKVFFDFERLDVFTPSFDMLVEAAGTDRMVFGSGAPLQYIDPQYVKLFYSKLNERDKERILSENMRSLFKL